MGNLNFIDDILCHSKKNLARYQESVCFKTFLRLEVVANKIMIRNIMLFI